jgi:hypothetical protein
MVDHARADGCRDSGERARAHPPGAFEVNRRMRRVVWLLAIELVGILAPLVLLPARLFSGPHGAPTLEGQYALEDVILVAASSASRRGRSSPPARSAAGTSCATIPPVSARASDRPGAGR